MPTPSNAAIVEFGEAMALVQRGPLSSDGANVAELGFRTALDMVEDLGRMGQDADDSLVAGVAGELARVLARRPLFTRKELRGGRPLDDVVADAANVFVKAVWRGAFAGVPPSSRDRRVALAVYRFAFQRGSKRLYAKTGANASDEADGED